MKIIKKPEEWVAWSPLSNTFDTKDGTTVAAEIIDNVSCMLDIFYVADIREKQRKEKGDY
jgi:hypothetical protein